MAKANTVNHSKLEISTYNWREAQEQQQQQQSFIYTRFKNVKKKNNLWKSGSSFLANRAVIQNQFIFDALRNIRSKMNECHQNTHNSVKYEVIWKSQITLPNMKY